MARRLVSRRRVLERFSDYFFILDVNTGLFANLPICWAIPRCLLDELEFQALGQIDVDQFCKERLLYPEVPVVLPDSLRRLVEDIAKPTNGRSKAVFVLDAISFAARIKKLHPSVTVLSLSSICLSYLTLPLPSTSVEDN